MITKLSDVKDIVRQAVSNPKESFPKIMELASSEDWKEREVAATILVETGKKKPEQIIQEMSLWAENINPNVRRTASEGLRDIARKNQSLKN
jgi:3-methyladenine DNA glycosylase AlkC